MGNGAVKECICMTHGHELRWGSGGGRGSTGLRGIEGKKLDNCNRIINTIVLKIKNRGILAKDKPRT